MMRRSILCKTFLLSLALALAALSSVWGRGKSEQPGTSPSASKTYATHLVFTMPAIDPDKAGVDNDGKPDPTFQWLQAKFNFEFEWIAVTWSDYFQEKPSLWMASGEQPDIIMLDISPSRYHLFLDWVKAGQLKAYPSLARYPNIQRNWDMATGGKRFAVGGKIYAMPSLIDTAKFGFINGRAWMYRKDWASAVGLRTANDEYTWEQWVNLIKTVIAKDPGGNGSGRTIGWEGQDYTFPRCWDAVRALSPWMQTYTQRDGKWVWGPQLPESLAAVKLTRQLFDMGLISKDQPTNTGSTDQVNTDFSTGKLFSTCSDNTTYGGVFDMTTRYENANPGKKAQDAIGYAIVRAPDGYIYPEQSPDHWTETAMAPNLSQEKVDRWLDIMDYLMSDEGYYMRNFGRPGIDWQIKDGKIVLGYERNADGSYKLPSGLNWDHSWQWVYRGGTTDSATLYNPANVKWIQDMVLATITRMHRKDVRVIPFNVDLNYFDGPNFSKVGTMEREIYQEIALLMNSKNVEKDWNTWVASQSAKVQPVLDELNASGIKVQPLFTPAK
jgi:hypothetical protein